MNRLIRLYPHWWRARYGDEFAALLAELRPSARVLIDVVLNAAGTRLDPAHLETEMGNLFGQVHERRDSRVALVVLALVAPTCVYLVLSVLKYGLGVDQPFDAAAPLFLNRAVEIFTVVAPAVALLLSLLPILRVRIGVESGHINAVLAFRARPLNLLVTLLAGAVVAVLVTYFFLENVLARGA